MSEELYVGTFFDDGHAEGAEVADLVFGEEGGAGAEDGAVEVLGCGEGGEELVDTGGISINHPFSRHMKGESKEITFPKHHRPPKTSPPKPGSPTCRPRPQAPPLSPRPDHTTSQSHR